MIEKKSRRNSTRCCVDEIDSLISSLEICSILQDSLTGASQLFWFASNTLVAISIWFVRKNSLNCFRRNDFWLRFFMVSFGFQSTCLSRFKRHQSDERSSVFVLIDMGYYWKTASFDSREVVNCDKYFYMESFRFIHSINISIHSSLVIQRSTAIQGCTFWICFGLYQILFATLPWKTAENLFSRYCLQVEL